MIAKIHKGNAKGRISAPPSKSYAHRYLIACMLAGGGKVLNISYSNDIFATINAIKGFGYTVIRNESSVEIIKDKEPDVIKFDCLESGSTLRFMIPIALTTGKNIFIKGTKRLFERGIDEYLKICDNQKIKYIKNETDIAFFGKLNSNDFYIPGNVSSQYLTGLMFSLPLLNGDSKLVLTTNLESKSYIDITKDVLLKSNIEIIEDNNSYIIKGNQHYKFNEQIVEGDASNAAFFEFLNYFGGCVQVDGININSYQGDIRYIEYFKKLSIGYSVIDLNDNIDLGPILFAFAGLKYGAEFINTKRLLIKESNRILTSYEELKKFGIEFEIKSNSVIVRPTNLHKASEISNTILNGHNDHRIVMMLSVVATIFGGIIVGAEAVDKSFPDFFSRLKDLNIEVEINE